MNANKAAESNIYKAELSLNNINNQDMTKSILEEFFELIPQNKRRSVNKTFCQSQYFEIVYNKNNNEFIVKGKKDIIFSTIPYDTSRNYMQKAAINYIKNPDKTRQYLKKHEDNIRKYIAAALVQKTNKKVMPKSKDVTSYFNKIFKDPAFEIQILGRMMQHDDTGPLSANLPGKFLYEENKKTGISAYIMEYIKFIIPITNQLPIRTNGKKVKLLEKDLINHKTKYLNIVNNNQIIYLEQPQDDTVQLPTNVINILTPIISKHNSVNHTQILLKSNLKEELSQVRKSYHAHSVDPSKLEKYFDNVLPTSNDNLINVISDIHNNGSELAIKNKNFNILVGDISENKIIDNDIKGIYVMGNHDIKDAVLNNSLKDEKKYLEFKKFSWFNTFVLDPESYWYLLPVGDNHFYEVVKQDIETRFSKIKVLNNESFDYQGIRYIGLTIPIVLKERKKQLQDFIFNTLKRLLVDQNIPTVIVSHAPLFNELSNLNPSAKAYKKENNCSDERILKLFEEYNIIGAIHGHHHIPASQGIVKKKTFVKKELFVVCSIYSNINTGFELSSLLPTTANNTFVDNVKKENLKEITVVKQPTAINKLKAIIQKNKLKNKKVNKKSKSKKKKAKR
ncbi:metallophosphoesterase [Mycoplasma sp. P36-A1]|uniref:metallophosphoesterase n=1 Tax=Mycoplasma sp. P36-A1 TaxID=3252900 RepID=UPI003C2F5070